MDQTKWPVKSSHLRDHQQKILIPVNGFCPLGRRGCCLDPLRVPFGDRNPDKENYYLNKSLRL